jgi:hypothetical protein
MELRSFPGKNGHRTNDLSMSGAESKSNLRAISSLEHRTLSGRDLSYQLCWRATKSLEALSTKSIRSQRL